MSVRDAYLRGIDAVITPNPDTAFDRHFEDVARGVAERADAFVFDEEEAPSQGLVPFEHRDAGPKPQPLLKSEIEGVSDEEWTTFAVAMRVAPYGAVSASNALGAWQMRLRRLEDLGLVKNLRKQGAWIGDFVAPLTRRKFLESPLVQYKTFAASMRRYVGGIEDGSVPTEDLGLSLSGMLAVLHRCGPHGLVSWGRESGRFSDTVSLVQKVDGVF